jgi:hypothetical protein
MVTPPTREASMDPKLVDQYVELVQERDRLQELIDGLDSLMLRSHKPGDVLAGTTRKLRIRDRAVLKADKLQKLVSKAMWLRITVRKPSADLYKAEIKRGKLNQSVIDEASDRSAQWIEVL